MWIPWGLLARAVKTDGRLKLDRIRWFPWNMIEGENCTVHVASLEKTHSGYDFGPSELLATVYKGG